MGTDVDARPKAVEDGYRQAEAKVTHQRHEVLRAVMDTDAPRNANTALKRIRERTPTMSFEPAYRTLSFLREHSLTSHVHARGERARYDENNERHPFSTCTAGDQMVDFGSAALNGMALPD
jgi:Fe2+ or Zn2+ uptake regulation protein